MDSNDICTPPDILELATEVTHRKKTTSFSENVILAYLKDLSDKFKPSSMWAKYSMLKSTLNIYNNIDITKYSKVIAFLKRNSEGHKGKKVLDVYIRSTEDVSWKIHQIFCIFLKRLH
ncbi:hypothetical protein ACJJTC_019678 [Scirpophaga incertulas]